MKGRYDDFIEDMVKDNINNPSIAPDQNLNDIAKKMEDQVKKALDKANSKEPVKVPKEVIKPEPEPEPEDIEDTDDNIDKEDL